MSVTGSRGSLVLTRAEATLPMPSVAMALTVMAEYAHSATKGAES